MAVDIDMSLEREVRYKCVKNFLDLLILVMVKEKPMSGYDVITYVYDRFQVLLSPGTVYSILDSMEKKGLIEGSQENRKKLYRLTHKGDVLNSFLSTEYIKFNSKFQILTGLYRITHQAD